MSEITDTIKCNRCGGDLTFPESRAVGTCMACRPWFVGVDPVVIDGEYTAVKCWCGEVASWRPRERRPTSCKKCAARFDFNQ